MSDLAVALDCLVAQVVGHPVAIENGAVPGASALRFDLNAWDARAAYSGPPPPVDWLIEGSLPRGQAGMICAMGDTGKSYLGLELGLRVTAGMLNLGPPIFGGRVISFGPVVIVCAKDGKADIHRRLQLLDPTGERRRLAYRPLHIVALPDAGGPFPLVVQRGHEVEMTPEFAELRARLVQLRPALIFFDPLQPFCHADLNADPCAASVLCSALGALAAETNATVMVSHHMRKPPASRSIVTPGEAREAIRGTTGLVDGLRFAFAIWPHPHGQEVLRVCRELGLTPAPNVVYRAAMVKANASQRRDLLTLARDPVSGLLIDHTLGATAANRERAAAEDAMVELVARAAREGHPFMLSGYAGFDKRRPELPDCLSMLGRDKLQEMVRQLETDGRIVRCAHGGEKGAKWFDIPAGPFATGIGTFSAGAWTGRPGRKPRATAVPDMAAA